MGKELQKTSVSSDSYLELIDNNQTVMMALKANMLPHETIDIPDLLRVPTPSGGSTMWQWEENGEVQTAKTIDGILVAFRARGVLWPYEEPGDAMPLLVTDDLVHARRVGDDFGEIDPEELAKFEMSPGVYDWQQLPWNQWGSGRNETGKRCKEQRLLFVLRQGDVWPTLIIAQPGSLRDVIKSIKMMPVPHWQAIVALSLVKEKSKAGIDYSKIQLSVTGQLDVETGEKVRMLYTSLLRNVDAPHEHTEEV